MKASDFVSCPEDLLSSALRYGEEIERAGWAIDIEPYNLAFPRTPVIVARRATVTRYIEVQSAVDRPVVTEWIGYAKSLDEDSRVVLVVSGSMPPAVDVAWLKEQGVGLVICEPYMSICEANDLALGIQLPSLPTELSPGLGEAYDLFAKGDWREGFEAAATYMEQEARDYLLRGVGRGRIQFVDNAGRPVTIAERRIRRMTLGQLAVTYRSITIPNVADSRVAEGLSRINDDRVTAAHYKGKAGDRAEQLRKNVGQHMYVVISVLRQIKGI